MFMTGMASGAGDQSGTVLYNRGIYSAMLVTEAARQAQRLEIKNLTGNMRVLEAFSIDEARMSALGLPNFAPSFVSCENHGGNGIAAIQQWDTSKTWKMVTDFIGRYGRYQSTYCGGFCGICSRK